MNTFFHYKLILLGLFLLISCGKDRPIIKYSDISAYSGSGNLQMVVEIPAGTNLKLEYDIETNTFLADKKNGEDRVIQFLPYLGNYGFIPSTLVDIKKGGDGDAIDVLLLSEHIATGTIIEILPIGVLVLEDSGEMDSKIIAVPIDRNLQILKTSSYETFHSNFYEVKQLIQLWFLGYKEDSNIKFISWEDENFARLEIEKWLIEE